MKGFKTILVVINTMDKPVNHGFFSQKQKMNTRGHSHNSSLCSSVIYLNEKGEEVEITEASYKMTPEEHKSRFSDSIYVGIVVKFVRSID